MKNEPDKEYCWDVIGIRGNRSCPELAKLVHCRNCKRYESMGRNLLDRAAPAAYIEEQTRLLAVPEIREDIKKQVAVVFRLSTEWLALPVRLFAEVTSPRPVRPVPHRSSQLFLGLVSIRGEIQLCFSMAELLGVLPSKEGKTMPAAGFMPRFCVIGKQERKWVFPADEIYGLYAYAENEVQPVPVTIAKTLQNYTLGIIAVNKRQAGLINDDLVFAAFERSLT